MSETLSLVPWAEQKLVRFTRWLSARHAVTTRLKEYEQMQQWTKSRLQVSTALDWGHTCDIAYAVNEGAKLVFGTSSHVTCWAFTSRTIVSAALGRHIEPAFWIKLLHFAIEVSHNLSVDDSVIEVVRDEAENTLFKARLRAKWVQYEEENFTDCGDNGATPGLLSLCTPNVINNQSGYGHKNIMRMHGKECLRNERIAASCAVDLLESIYYIYCNGVQLERTCKYVETLRDRAMQNETCGGARVMFCSNPGQFHPLDTNTWSEMTTLWGRFVENWDLITSNAARSFSFPIVPNLDQLVFHDMVTGIVACSKMFRTGGKFSSSRGTTVVHPSEQAAIVSSACTLVQNRCSTLDMNGVLRKWNSAAEEFAHYALLRCDLVRRSRMTFREAVRDWESQYTSWDRAPKSISEWSKVDDERCYDVTGSLPDDYRLVLLRQALGRPHSIDIVTTAETETSILGGYVNYIQRMPPNKDGDKRILIDQPFYLNVNMNTGLSSFSKDTRGIRDRWGGTYSFKRDTKGFYNKVLEETGKPDILRIAPRATFSCCMEKSTVHARIILS